MNSLKEIIVDFQNTLFETGLSRHVEVTPIPGKATVCIGVRRCGKSTFMFQIIQRLIDAGVQRQNIQYLNFFDDRLHGLQNESLNIIVEAYFSLYP